MRRAVLVVALAGCSNILGIDNLHGSGGDGDGGTDAPGDSKPPPDVIVGPHLTVSGTVRLITGTTSMPAGDHQIEVVRTSDSLVLGHATTDAAQGAFSIDVPTGSMPVDAHLHVDVSPTVPGEFPSTQYFAHPLTADTANVSVTMLTQQSLNLIAQVGNVQQGVLAFAATFVNDANGNPLANAVVTTQPAGLAVRYCDSNQLPQQSLTATSAIGLAMIFNVPPGMFIATSSVPGVQTASQTIDIPQSLGVFYLTLQP